jgi:hypothetical protein
MQLMLYALSMSSFYKQRTNVAYTTSLSDEITDSDTDHQQSGKW